MMPHGLDTTPIIDEYGVYWSRTYGQKTANADWCVTQFYDVVGAPYGNVNIQGFVGADSINVTFQYTFSNNSTGWYYFAGTNPRRIPAGTDRRITSISFSIQQTEIDNSYVYIVETGQILFAGKNSIYYGHRNISELN